MHHVFRRVNGVVPITDEREVKGHIGFRKGAAARAGSSAVGRLKMELMRS